MKPIGVWIMTGTKQRSFFALWAFLAVSIVLAVPMVALDVLPVIDVPNHIARHFLTTYQGGPLDTYYEYGIAAVPNSAVDFAWYFWGDGADPVAFAGYSFAFYCVAFMASLMLLARALHGCWTLWPLAAGLVCYNANLFWGFQNYLVTIPFGILGIWLWLISEKWVLWQRLLAITPLVIVIFFGHFFVFGALAILVFGRELQRIYEADTTRLKVLGEAVVLALPFVAALLWLWFTVLSAGPSESGNHTEMGPFIHRIRLFQSVSLPAAQFLSVEVYTAGVFAFVMVLLFLGAIFSRRIFGGLNVAPSMRGPLLALGLASLLMPFWINGVAWVNIRYPFLFVALLVASSQWRALGRGWALAMAALVALIVVGQSVSFYRIGAQHSAEVSDFISLLDEVPTESRVLHTLAGLRASDMRLWHLGGYAVVEKEVFVPSLFQGLHSLRVKDAWVDSTAPATGAIPLAWLSRVIPADNPLRHMEHVRNWDQKFDYVVVSRHPNAVLEEIALPQELGLVAIKGRFSLYRILPDR